MTIPTYNEAENIAIPLRSAYDLVDEVVIVDGGSTDDTIARARAFGDKVVIHHVDNPPNFLLNKQRAIEFASGDWILQLDADEAISPELAAEIRSLLEVDAESDQTDTVAGYRIPRKNWFLNRYLMKGGVYPDYVIRLYRRESAHFALENVHENVIIDGPIGETKQALLHYADPDFERYLSRWNRYTSFDAALLVEQLQRDGQKLEWQDGFEYLIVKPAGWFLSTYVRHKGFLDGFPGFVFCLFSAIRFWAIYIKAWHRLHPVTPEMIQ